MKGALHHVWPPGIRTQLMLWYTAVFAVLIFCSDTLLYTQLQTSLTTSLDTALQLQAEQIAGGINNDGGTITIKDVTGDLPDSYPNTAEQPSSHMDVNFGALVRILDTKGHTLRASPAFSTLIVPLVSITQTLHGVDWQGSVTTRDGQEVRVYSIAVTENNVPFAVIQIGESLLQLNTSLRSVLIELLIIAPFVLLLGAVGSYWLASRAFVPIDRLTRMALQIKAGELHQHVPVPRAYDEIHRLALTLNEMIKRLDEAFTRQRRFVADASHELRTPVAIIRSMTDLALLKPITLEDHVSILSNINTEAERLGSLIGDLLDLARIDEGQTLLEQKPVRLDLLIDAVAGNAELIAAEDGITVHVQALEPTTVLGDEARLIQATMNLLDNAIIYTHPGGCITLTVTIKHDQACLSIRDTGIGIAPEHIPHIFERFYRVDPAHVRTKGNNSGLGLSIVDWVVRAHGGSIAVESQIGQGSTFTVTLPLASPLNLHDRSVGLRSSTQLWPPQKVQGGRIATQRAGLDAPH